ncbi:MAG TPA: lactate utilization protein [Ktedonobacteraceae bacterium]|jgi:L-lactate dehydrogenase complex protein LldG
MTTQTTQALYQRFQQRLTAAGGESYLLENVKEAADVIALHHALREKTIIVSPHFSQCQPWNALLPLLTAKDIHIREAGSPASVADAPAGLSYAELAIAETGSVLLAENSLEGRVVGMLTLTHFVLVRLQDLVPMLDQAGARLKQYVGAGSDQRRYMSFVTGPSRTADIERTLTIGVQGPREVCVLVVDCS